eukprot:CAMPEP_0206435370 /NCGR_PEP_ID=MMETSP0324_2-20121206/9807_1 /ASSEMBLY_ACC=CAM_ASM_000836 /TAXON_ID=2866 /ORGANISM="Crypthecodinium cohnii, Strain Seligo" /LENGTH=303 /DNA_ID=CAMNT_0053902251 /DNA_START=102 /DNA_END=1010 /DNA_ORIENTATION=+
MICVGYPSLAILMAGLQVSPIGSGLSIMLFDTSLISIQSFRLWSLFLGAFYALHPGSGLTGMDFLMGLFTLYMILQYFPRRERTLGSTAHLLWIMAINALANILRLAVMTVLVYVFQMPIYAFNSSIGLWPVMLADLTVFMMGDPDGSTSFWGMITLPNKVYPLALVGFLCLLNRFSILWDMVAAVAVGYAYGYFRLERFMPTPERAARLEQLSCCRQGRFEVLGASWVPACSAQAFGQSGSSNNMSDFSLTSGQQLTSQGDSNRGRPAQFEAFSGAGNTLGDGGGRPNQSSSAYVPTEPNDW